MAGNSALDLVKEKLSIFQPQGVVFKEGGAEADRPVQGRRIAVEGYGRRSGGLSIGRKCVQLAGFFMRLGIIGRVWILR